MVGLSLMIQELLFSLIQVLKDSAMEEHGQLKNGVDLAQVLMRMCWFMRRC